MAIQTESRKQLHTPTACRLTTRHYFEDERCAAADPARHVPLRIDPVVDPGPPPPWSDERMAAAIRRVINFVRGDTLDAQAPDPSAMPAFVSTTRNVFNPPAKPGNMAFSAMDIAYAQTVYALGPEEALVMTGRFPRCRSANVTLWNRYLQSYDFNNRGISLNRKQTQLEPDGSYRMVIAHRNPGVPNWLDTEGRESGTIFWRFVLPDPDPGEVVETPKTTVVPFATLAG